MLNLTEFGALLRREREKRGLTQSRAAEAVGLSERTVRRIEAGYTVPDLMSVLRIMDLYGIPFGTLEVFYTRAEDMAYVMELLDM